MARQSSYELDERAAEAAFLLNHPLLKEAFDSLQKNYVEQIIAASGDEMIEPHAKIRVLQEVKEHLQSIVSDKKIADKKGVKYG